MELRAVSTVFHGPDVSFLRKTPWKISALPIYAQAGISKRHISMLFKMFQIFQIEIEEE